MDNRVVSIRTGRRNAFRDKIIKRLYTTIRDVQKKMLSVEGGLKGDRKYDDLVRLNYRSRDAIRNTRNRVRDFKAWRDNLLLPLLPTAPIFRRNHRMRGLITANGALNRRMTIRMFPERRLV